MTSSEAAQILGVDVETIERWQQAGKMPDPIPDDYLDPVVDFRIKLEQAHRRRIDRMQQGGGYGKD